MTAPMSALTLRLPWPLPALLAWGAGWLAWQAALHAGLPPPAAWTLGLVAGTVLARGCRGRWRRALAAGGFPLSTLALGALPALPAWGWALAVLPLAALHPPGTWRDAPFFPTPRDALRGLPEALGVAVPGTGLRVLDAGCGLGHGLFALRAAWPAAALQGVERGRALAWAARWRARSPRLRAQVRQGDMWATDWSGHDLVYLFQRPETMPRAWDKACAEMRLGAWLVSLEFEVPGAAPAAVLRSPGSRTRPVWAYRIPARPGSTARAAGR